jgi:uncharacterized membrane protein
VKHLTKIKLNAHRRFEAALLLKGIDGILEILGGILLLFYESGQAEQIGEIINTA